MKSLDKPIRLLLADDHPLVRAGIRAELEKFSRVKVVGEAGNGREALQMVKLLHPDVVFIDVSMPGLNGLEALTAMTRDFPAVRVIVLSMHDNEEYIWRAMRAGAAGYLLKKAASTELGDALQSVTRGEIYLCTELAARLGKKFLLRDIAARKSPLDQLTSRQREILQLIAEGMNTKGIAAVLKLSPKTIEYHRMKLMQALNVHEIQGLVRFALRVGLVAHEF